MTGLRAQGLVLASWDRLANSPDSHGSGGLSSAASDKQPTANVSVRVV